MGKKEKYIVKIWNLSKKELKSPHAKEVHEINPDAKYLVENQTIKCSDICYSLSDAIRYYFWHKGLSPRIAFFKLKYLLKCNRKNWK